MEAIGNFIMNMTTGVAVMVLAMALCDTCGVRGYPTLFITISAGYIANTLFYKWDDLISSIKEVSHVLRNNVK